MIRVALAETQQLFCSGIQAILSTIAEVNFINDPNCQSAFITLCQKTQPDVALIALNIVQEEPEILHTMHQSFPQTKILILLAQQENIDFNWLMHLNVASVMHKNDTSEQLVTAIKFIMQGNRWISPSIIAAYSRQITTQPVIDLTKRELEILQMVAAEKTDKQVALTLNISDRTVRTHLQQIYAKLGVNTRVGAAVQAVRLNLLRE